MFWLIIALVVFIALDSAGCNRYNRIK
jgi:predicted small secreted protein